MKSEELATPVVLTLHSSLRQGGWAALEFPKVRELLARQTEFVVGTELAHSLTPLTNEADVRRAQDVTEEARWLLEVRPNTGIRSAPDIRRHIRHATLEGTLQTVELLEVAAIVAAGRAARNLVLHHSLQAPTLAEIGAHIAAQAGPGAGGEAQPPGPLSAVGPADPLEQSIRRAIDVDGQVQDTASARLRAIRTERRAAHERLMRRLHEIIASPALRDALQEPLVTLRQGRYVIPVKADVRGRVPGIIHDQSASGATVFVEPLSVVELANHWRQGEIQEEKEVARILRALSRRVASAAPALAQTVGALADLDLAFAKARLAIAMAAVRPGLVSIPPQHSPLRPEHSSRSTQHSPASGGSTEPAPSDASAVRLLAARHPLLQGNVVPIDVELGGTFDVLLISGPNTGGKTVALKTVGLLALMAQAGLQIPAAPGSRLAIFSGVYADIGDEQSIEQSLSTFSSHVSRIISILSDADPSSLVLLDEIGAGTDPDEGAALGRALLGHLAKSRILTIATTHSSDLKLFAASTPRVRNASVEFDVETLRPTYRLITGLPGQSNALIIAERLGMAKDLVAEARRLLHPSDRGREELLIEIRDQLARTRADRAEAEQLRKEAERAADQLQSEIAALQQGRDATLERAEAEAVALLAEVQREVDTLRRELRGLRADRDRLTAIETRLAETHSRAVRGGPRTKSDAAERSRYRPGDTVTILSLGSTGTVRWVPETGETIEVEIGVMRAQVPIADLAPASGKITEPQAPPTLADWTLTHHSALSTQHSPEWGPIESQIELRGETVDQATERLDRYLNDAYLTGVRVVRVIHGKGTGALRQAVRDLVSDHPLVRSYRNAEPREGGEGATILYLASIIRPLQGGL